MAFSLLVSFFVCLVGCCSNQLTQLKINRTKLKSCSDCLAVKWVFKRNHQLTKSEVVQNKQLGANSWVSMKFVVDYQESILTARRNPILPAMDDNGTGAPAVRFVDFPATKRTQRQ